MRPSGAHARADTLSWPPRTATVVPGSPAGIVAVGVGGAGVLVGGSAMDVIGGTAVLVGSGIAAALTGGAIGLPERNGPYRRLPAILLASMAAAAAANNAGKRSGDGDDSGAA
jgi:hypothetical protein